MDTHDTWLMSGTYLFYTLKAHEVMQDFMRLNIKDHSSISSEMTKFICYNQASTDFSEIFDKLTILETSHRSDQAGANRLMTRMTKVERFVAETKEWMKQAEKKK
mmetsp:Transcript_11714/g.14589  ORF Transcript_11714/g.14589 Transcript_11714/m.14589 type:complete len:105 (+) Transcript_11714:478-792(+)